MSAIRLTSLLWGCWNIGVGGQSPVIPLNKGEGGSFPCCRKAVRSERAQRLSKFFSTKRLFLVPFFGAAKKDTENIFTPQKYFLSLPHNTFKFLNFNFIIHED